MDRTGTFLNANPSFAETCAKIADCAALVHAETMFKVNALSLACGTVVYTLCSGAVVERDIHGVYHGVYVEGIYTNNQDICVANYLVLSFTTSFTHSCNNNFPLFLWQRVLHCHIFALFGLAAAVHARTYLHAAFLARLVDTIVLTNVGHVCVNVIIIVAFHKLQVRHCRLV